MARMSDGIVLTGLPGAGKSTIGRAVAQKLGRPFINIDREIERTTGKHPFHILAKEVEPDLRAFERYAVSSAAKSSGAVISTGGGTTLDPMNRWLLMDHGLRVRLEAPIDQLADRLRTDTETPRPLLGGDLEEGLRRTAEARAGVYAAVDAVVDASGDVDAIVDAVIGQSTLLAGWRPLLDTTFERHHPIGPPLGRLRTGRCLDGRALEIDGRPAYVVDRRVSTKLAGERVYELDGGEQVKTMAHLERLLQWFSENDV